LDISSSGDPSIQGFATDISFNKGDTVNFKINTHSTLVTSHSVALTGLTAGTTYHYRADSRDSAGTLASSADASFATTSASLVGDSKIEANNDTNAAGSAEALK
jgi:hypothetical protein